MRSFTWSLVLAVATLGVFAAAAPEAQAQVFWRWRAYPAYYSGGYTYSYSSPAYSTSYYYTPDAGYTPGYYYRPRVYRSYYYGPGYGYSYGPGYYRPWGWRWRGW
jgi:hypothetical protein